MKAWINGKITDWADATVHLMSHSFSRASAIFEVMELISTDDGPAFFGLDEHIDRFFKSAESTFMEVSISVDGLKQALVETVKANNLEKGVIKIYGYYSGIEMGNVPLNIKADIAVLCVDTSASSGAADPFFPVTVGISTFRKLHPDTTAIHAKIAGNYVNSHLARMEVKKRGFDEALMLDTKGLVAEGPTAKIFFVKDKEIFTPTLDNILPGITRQMLIQIAHDMELIVNECRILPEDLENYEEAFFSGTPKHVIPISRIEDIAFKTPGAVSVLLINRIGEVLSGKLPAYRKLITHVC